VALLRDRNDVFTIARSGDHSAASLSSALSSDLLIGAATLAKSSDLAVNVLGGAGNDRLNGGGGDDYLLGMSGKDVLFGGAGRDLVDGGSGSDFLRGGVGNDHLQGGRGDDRLRGGTGSDLLEGDGPASMFRDDPTPRGADTLRGGRGVDSAVYDFTSFTDPLRAAPKLNVTLDSQANDGRSGERDNVASDVERAYSLALSGLHPTASGWAVDSGGGVRFYRLSKVGTAAAESALANGRRFDVREHPGDASTDILLPKTGFRRCGVDAGLALSHEEIHRLRVRAHGRFRTRGRYSTTRGISTATAGQLPPNPAEDPELVGDDWVVADRCDGTLTKVSRGSVVVRDFRQNRSIVLRAGESYLART
jgi:hypothetical protein